MSVQGFPDDGNGVFSRHIAYDQWFRLNVTKRVKDSQLEHMSILLPSSVSWKFLFF